MDGLHIIPGYLNRDVQEAAVAALRGAGHSVEGAMP